MSDKTTPEEFVTEIERNAYRAGKLEATEAHLKDLQRIVFDHGLFRAREINVEGDNSGTIHVEDRKGGLIS